MSARPRPVRVFVEATDRRAFASALDWPGWARGAKNEEAAVAALAAHAERYAAVAAEAAVTFAPGEYSVVERLPGTATTDFGVPDRAAAADLEPLTSADARRTVALVAAAWLILDRVAAGAPQSLRKGPRGGGRDRDAIVDHVLGAEQAYARKLGVRVPAPRRGDKKSIAALRDPLLGVLGSAHAGAPLVEGGWLPRYGARRIAWHVLDHAWEIENRSEA